MKGDPSATGGAFDTPSTRELIRQISNVNDERRGDKDSVLSSVEQLKCELTEQLSSRVDGVSKGSQKRDAELKGLIASLESALEEASSKASGAVSLGEQAVVASAVAQTKASAAEEVASEVRWWRWRGDKHTRQLPTTASFRKKKSQTKPPPQPSWLVEIDSHP